MQQKLAIQSFTGWKMQMMMDIHTINLKRKLVLLEQKQTQRKNLMKDLLLNQLLKRQSRVMAQQSLVFTIREMCTKLDSIHMVNEVAFFGLVKNR